MHSGLPEAAFFRGGAVWGFIEKSIFAMVV